MPTKNLKHRDNIELTQLGVTLLQQDDDQDAIRVASEEDSASASLLSPSMPATITRSETKIPRVEEPEVPQEEEQDAVSGAVGDFGAWQLRLTFLLALFNLPCTWHIMAITFQTRPISYWCERPTAFMDAGLIPEAWRNISHSKNDSSCEIWDLNYTAAMLEDMGTGAWLPDMPEMNETKTCEGWEFDTSDGETIVSQWQLVCNREQLSNVAEMMFLAGVALGGLISGMISDRFGRKTTLMSSLFIQVCAGTGIAFTPWFELYMILRIILGVVSVSVVFSAFVLCMEIVGGKWRTISGVSFLFPVPLGYITISGIAYLIRGWRYLQLAVTLPAILLFSLIWVLPESPRWLLATGKREQLLGVLQKGAIVNKLPAPQAKQFEISAEEKKAEEEGHRPGFIDLFRTSNIRRISLLLYVIWFTLYLVYYGLQLNMGNMAGNVYLNVVIGGCVELPAIALSILLLLRSGRKVPLCLTIAGSGIACLCSLAVPQDDPSLTWLTLTFTMLGKFSISCSNAILPVFTAELYPTVVRNLGVGSSNVAAGIALMLVPYLWNLSSISALLPMGVLGGMGIVGGLCVLLLPETAGRPLPNTLAELEERANQRHREHAAELREQSNTKHVPRENIRGSYRKTMSPERF